MISQSFLYHKNCENKTEFSKILLFTDNFYINKKGRLIKRAFGWWGIFTFRQPIAGLLGTRFLPWTNIVSTYRKALYNIYIQPWWLARRFPFNLFARYPFIHKSGTGQTWQLHAGEDYMWWWMVIYEIIYAIIYGIIYQAAAFTSAMFSFSMGQCTILGNTS